MVSDRQLEKLGKRWVEIIIQLLQNNKPHAKYATGKLVNTLKFKTYRNEDGDKIIELVSAKGDNGFEYLKVIDQGRKPGKYVPIKNLVNWIRVKGIQGVNKKTKKPISTESLAFAISNSIQRKGIKATFVIKNSIEQLFNPRTITEIEDQLAIEIVDLLKLKFERG